MVVVQKKKQKVLTEEEKVIKASKNFLSLVSETEESEDSVSENEEIFNENDNTIRRLSYNLEEPSVCY